MDDSMFLSMVVGIGVIVLVGAIGFVMSGSFAKVAEQRLEGLTGGGGKRTKEQLASGILLRPRPSTSELDRSGASSSPTLRT